jgi:GH15 family glucan-1,4-alpha-glucosidase
VDAPDAATLLVPASGMLPTTHPVVRRTIEVVRSELAHDGLVHRYLVDDGLEGQEGAFLLCSFWLVDNLAYTYDTHGNRLVQVADSGNLHRLHRQRLQGKERH